MKKKIYFVPFLLMLLLSSSLTFSQGPGEPYFPETANGAKNAYFQYHSLRWQNPIETIYNEIYIHYDSSKVANMDQSALYVSGYPSTAFDSIRINQQLFMPTRYFWCVVEYNSSGFTKGDVWYFTTTWQGIDFYQLDDFSFGLGKWNINNVGGCGWQIGESINYTLPPPATSKLLRADKNLCGNLINATATFQQVNIMNYMYYAWLEFDSDWKAENPNDIAMVEMTTNSGSTWTTIWQKTGISDRNKHLNLELFSFNGEPYTIYTVQVRFRTIQYGTDSWWAIDNVGIMGRDYYLSHFHPYITNVRIDYSPQPKMIVNFQLAVPIPDVNVERKIGIPLFNSDYQIIASFPIFYTATFIDSTITDSTIYTYRISRDEGWPPNSPWYVYSNEATGYVFPPIPVELMSFTAEVNKNDITLIWLTATETNNSGFEILRFAQNDNNECEKKGFVPGHGTTTETQHYSFTDNDVKPGKYQYKLKQIDYDGTFEYSQIVEAEIPFVNEFSLSQNYPNPFNPTTSLQLAIGSRQFVTLKVYDLLGREIATLVNEEKPAGEYEVEFDATGLQSGVYFYTLRAGSFVESKKLLLLK